MHQKNLLLYASVYGIKQEKKIINLWKNLKKRKIHFNYLPVKLNDRYLPNNVHEA